MANCTSPTKQISSCHPARAAVWLPGIWLACAVGMCVLGVSSAHAQYNSLPTQTDNVGIDDKIGTQLPLDLDLVDESGKQIKLSEYFNFNARSGGRPVVLAMVYYDCPVACPAMLNNLSQALSQIDYVAGKDFNVLVVSFDPTNTTEDASDMRDDILRSYTKMATDDEPTIVADGWHFHTTTDQNAKQLADAIGFRYRYLPKTDEYSHPTAAFVITPEGVVSTYFANLFSSSPRNTELALIEASDGKLARTLANKVASFCYRFDPTTGTATFRAFRLMQIVGVFTAIGIAMLIGTLWYYEKKHPRKIAGAPALGQTGSRTLGPQA